MKSIRSLVKSKEDAGATVVDFRLVAQRHLTEYILNMAMSAIAHEDLTPMYETYMEDPRLSDDDRDELARAYLLLQMASTQTVETA